MQVKHIVLTMTVTEVDKRLVAVLIRRGEPYPARLCDVLLADVQRRIGTHQAIGVGLERHTGNIAGERVTGVGADMTSGQGVQIHIQQRFCLVWQSTFSQRLFCDPSDIVMR